MLSTLSKVEEDTTRRYGSRTVWSGEEVMKRQYNQGLFVGGHNVYLYPQNYKFSSTSGENIRLDYLGKSAYGVNGSSKGIVVTSASIPSLAYCHSHLSCVHVQNLFYHHPCNETLNKRIPYIPLISTLHDLCTHKSI